MLVLVLVLVLRRDATFHLTRTPVEITDNLPEPHPTTAITITYSTITEACRISFFLLPFSLFPLPLAPHITNMSRSADPGHFFQTDASESTRARKAVKSGNKNGNPIVLQSKILNVVPDPFSSTCIYLAESAGCVRKVNVEVGMTIFPCCM